MAHHFGLRCADRSHDRKPAKCLVSKSGGSANPDSRLRDPDSGTVVLVDPFLSPHAGRTWQAPISPPEMGRQADVVLCTHQHLDHFDQPALKSAAAVDNASFTLIVPRPIVGLAVDLGIPHERVIGAQPRDSFELGGATVHAVPARHGVDVSDTYTFGEQLSGGLVRYLGYVVELGGVRAYHAGDTVPYHQGAHGGFDSQAKNSSWEIELTMRASWLASAVSGAAGLVVRALGTGRQSQNGQHGQSTHRPLPAHR